jgi:hypothetical protein
MNNLGFTFLSAFAGNQERQITAVVTTTQRHEGVRRLGASPLKRSGGVRAVRERIARRSERIESMDFSREGDAPAQDILRLARGAE